MGVGYNTDYRSNDEISHTGFNVDFADNARKLSRYYLVAYPYSDQVDVPIDWYAKENPNPFRSLPRYIGKTVGYPVTIQGATTDRLIISSFSIETADGAKVPCHEIDSQTPLMKGYLHGAAMCVPYKPYAPNTKYTATVTGTKNNQPFTVTWSWTTATSTLVTASSDASMFLVEPN
jgi:hypothetical protein